MLRDARKPAAGFTLIELLIVIVLLGVLAGIVIPSFANNNAKAKEAALAKVVQTVRSQVLLYKMQHGDELPNLPNASALNNHFRPLLEVSTYGTPPRDYGPYLLSVPVNPVTGGSRVRNATSVNAAGLPDPIPGADFIYDYGGGNGTGGLWGTVSSTTGVPLAP